MARYLINPKTDTNSSQSGTLNLTNLEELIAGYTKRCNSALIKAAPKERLLALYDFVGTNDKDLSLSKGDMVAFIIQKKEWILCSTSDFRKGWVPANHLAPVSLLFRRY